MCRTGQKQAKFYRIHISGIQHRIYFAWRQMPPFVGPTVLTVLVVQLFIVEQWRMTMLQSCIIRFDLNTLNCAVFYHLGMISVPAIIWQLLITTQQL
jgi:hypothetical protein